MKKSNPRIILTLDQNELTTITKNILEKVSCLEVRFDLLTKKFVETSLVQRLKLLGRPVIFTIRKQKDSSMHQIENIPEGTIFQVLENFNSQKNYLDIEMDSKSIFTDFRNNKFSTILSYHDFYKSISRKKMKSMIMKNCIPRKKQIFKFAVTPKNIEEVACFLDDTQFLSKEYSLISIAMGELGIVSRIFGDHFGSKFTYCCLSSPKAPGQVSLKAMNNFRKEV
ncbi:MAG: type I 3-dehydroquinate dehydratase [Leptospiraceae bacterium]|nr:type I 3-dehydroquinate dehydratase [Leptospiraceae bacterium]MCK6381962.1 type I 3-dehydroquinate dehydratase [Leptospiraceae bacterium]NUM40300.1 type I 3-dehydroquinate dehydratase [Leptospiraceae bacterium]